MNLEKYVELALKDEKLRRTTNKRISDMIKYYGRQKVFGKIYGLEKQISQIMDFFDRAGRGSSFEERMLLLMGPPGSGKSSIVDSLKHHYEEYSKTEEGRIYAVKGCPLHEDPLNLIPHEKRKGLEQKGLHLHSFANPCPVCKLKIKKGKKIKVERIYVSEQERIGVAKHISSDPKSEDISTLIGEINFKNVEKYGSLYHPKTYDFNGEIFVGNRGILDWTEIFKSKHTILTMLLELVQSKIVKTHHFPSTFADTVVIGHTNEAEYEEFVSEGVMEPLKARIHKIDVPYNMRKEHEMRIYKKIMEKMDKAGGTKKHIGPYALEFAAGFAIESRVGRKNRKNGMQGISPRFLQDVVSLANKPDSKCIGFTDILTAIEETFELSPEINESQKKEYKDLLDYVQQDFAFRIEQKIKEEVVKTAFSPMAQELYARYVSIAAKYAGRNHYLKKEEEAFADKIEKNLNLFDGVMGKEFRKGFGKRALEENWCKKRISYLNEGKGMKNAILNIVYGKVKGAVEAYACKKDTDDATKKRIVTIKKALMQNGYCKECSDKMLTFLADFCTR